MDQHPTTTNGSMQSAFPGGTLQNLLAAASMNNNFNQMNPQQHAMMPFSDPALAAQLAMQSSASMGQPHFNILQQLAQVQQQNPAALASMLGAQEAPRPPEPARTVSRGRPAKSADTNNRGANSYASRHQQAEARRRMRINERLDALRRIVPHTERANTAVFLEDVVRYVQILQHRVFDLETKLGLPPTVQPLPTAITFGEQITPDATAATGPTGASSMERLAFQAALQQAAVAMMSPEQLAQLAAATGQMPQMPFQQQQQQQQQQLGPLSTAEELAMARELAAQPNTAAAVMAESQPAARQDSAAAGGGGMMIPPLPTAAANNGSSDALRNMLEQAAGVDQQQQQQQQVADAGGEQQQPEEKPEAEGNEDTEVKNEDEKQQRPKRAKVSEKEAVDFCK